MLLVSLLLRIAFVILYPIGGQGHRWAKKWVGPSLLALSGLLLADRFSWLILVGSLGFIGAANSFSYGTDWTQGKLWKKVLFRGLCGAMYGLCWLMIYAGLGNWIRGLLSLIIAISGSIIFGVFNPFSKLKFGKFQNIPTISEDICIAVCYIF